MQLGTRPGAAPKMCPDKLTQFNPDGERQETMAKTRNHAISPPWHNHAPCKRFHTRYIFLKKEETAVHRSSPALFIQLNNSSVPVTSQQLAGVGFPL